MRKRIIFFILFSVSSFSFANPGINIIFSDSTKIENRSQSDSLARVNALTIEHIKKIFSNHKGKRPTIGLALAGGGAKGFAHSGVLELIDSLNIPVDYIAGNSMGGLVAALYSIGFSGKELEKYVSNLDWGYLLNDSPNRETLPFIEKKKTGVYQLSVGLDGVKPAVPSGLIYGQNIQMEFLKHTTPFEGINDFDKLPIPFRCVAVDLASGKEIVLKSGSLAKAMRATMSIPSAFSPVDWSNYLLVDGLVLNNFPVDVVKAMGADIVIGLNLTTGKMSKEKLRDIFSILDRTVDIPMKSRLEKNIRTSDIYISQDLKGFSTSDFDSEKIKEIISRGKEAGERNLDVLVALRNELEKYDDYLEWKNKGKAEMREKIEQRRKDFTEFPPVILEINIVGNKKIETNFILEYLDIKVGDYFSSEVIKNKISDLYALNYFESVNYSITSKLDAGIVLNININEKRFNKIVAGFRYDDHFKLVGLFGVETNSAVIKGAQMEAYIRFGGITQFDISVLYPTRSMDMPIYPFVRMVYKDLPINFYFKGTKNFSYNNRSLNFLGGLNFSLSKFWDLETSMFYEMMNVKTNIASKETEDLVNELNPEARIVAGKARLLFDSLDDSILPKSGLYFKSAFEISMKDVGADIQYHKFFAKGRVFFPIAHDHNISFRAGYYFASRGTPFYKWYYLGGTFSFVGIDYFQAHGSEFTIGQINYRYEFFKDIYLRGIYNVMFNYNLWANDSPIHGKPILGGGVSLIMKTMFGRAELMWSRGDVNLYSPGKKSNKFYFNFGYKLF